MVSPWRCATLAALAVVACLPAAQAQPMVGRHRAPSCFYISQLGGFRADGGRTVYARVSGRDVYRFDLASDCEGLRGHEGTIVLKPVSSGSICAPLDVDLSVRSHGTSERCLIRDIVRLTPQAAAALPNSVKP